MTEEPEEVEASHSEDSVEPAGEDQPPRVATDQAADMEDAATSFLEVESRIGTGTASGQVLGRAVDVERVPASAIPADYPVEIRTEEALALAVDVDDERVPVYFAFEPDGPADDRLERLLQLKDIAPGRFADLYGESIRLTAEDRHYIPVVPDEPPRGSSLGVYGVGAGLAVNLLAVALLVVGPGGVFSVPVVLAWLAANVLGVPAATYLDAWYLRTHTDWAGGPLFWATLGAIPVVNVLSSTAYLRQRARATEL